jgi:pSer/pThr/pTyr-binding forkhead associated (FHA) protein
LRIVMDSFLTACGASDLLTLEIEGPGFPVPDRRVFAQPFVLIGRDERADLLLDHDAVSRRHTYLQVVEGRLFFIDLDSRIGTSAGEVQAESGWIDPGQPVAVGPFTVRQVPFPGVVLTPPPPSPLLARSAAGPAGLPHVALEFQSRAAGYSVWRMSQVLALVGKSSRCKVRLFDSLVSRLHCALVRTPQGLWAVDLLGRGGIAINGVSTRSGALGPGDSLSLGQVVVRASFDDPAARAGTAVPVVWSGHNQPGAWGSRGGTGHGQEPGPASATPFLPAPVAPPFLGTPGRFVSEPAGGADLARQEPALELLLSHFGQMQQQMMDQFQQSMMMMLQMFGGMHRDQMGLVKEELDRLRELNGEIVAIKAELAQRALPVPVPASVPPPVALTAGPGPAAAPPPVAPEGGFAQPVHGGRPAAGGGVPPGPAVGSPEGQASVRPALRPVQAPGFAAANANANAGATPPPLPPAAPPPRAAVVPPGDLGADVHEWLNERLNAITTEQQNRWQKIMTMLRGAR